MMLLSWQIEFARPLWFALLAALPLWIVFWRRSLVRLSTGRRSLAIALRIFLLVVVAAGLAGPMATSQPSLPIFVAKTIAPPAAAPPPAAVLVGPDHVRAGEPISLDLAVNAEANGATNVEVLRDSQPLTSEKMPLVAGENHLSIADVVTKPSRAVYTVKISGVDVAGKLRLAGDAGGMPQRAGTPAALAACAVYVDPPPRVLLIESQAALAEPLRKALAGENVEVEVRPDLPAESDSLNRYDLIILSNVPAKAVSKEQMKALQRYVHDAGGGLIAVGGDHSFTVGGYRDTPLEQLLPVISESHTPKPKPTLAMVLVLDISGSMNDPVSKGSKERNIDLAKEALRSAVRMLGPRDQVGVLVFEDASRWIWPLAPVTDQNAIIARINTIEAEGETNMYPPLEKAYLALRESFADVKHIIVSTDGIGGPGDFDGLAEKMAAAGITMSTVGVGSEPVRAFMQSLAEKAKGRAYFCDNGKDIPHIFETDTVSAAKLGITEEPFFPKVIHATQALRGLNMSQAPTLLGYVETTAKPEAHVVLAAKTGEPILAVWRYGRGATAAFTSDVQSRWAAPWLTWPGFSRFWVRLARATMRREPPQSSRLTAAAADGRLDVTLDAVDREGSFIDAADARVSVEEPDGKTAELAMTQTAPGRYAAAQPAGPGTYWLDAKIQKEGKQFESARGAAVVLSMPKTAVKEEFSIEAVERSGPRTSLLWPWLLAAAVILLVLDLAIRRTARPP